uniref:Reverse transcriptase domain-containing protein n=1 Tax=Oryzias sinensis TaxID=183150 RepID=A0A8C7X432_9TELE
MFQEELVKILHRLFEYVFNGQFLLPSFCEGRIKLLFKGKGDRADLENYRPITLLNLDYKILASILAGRLRDVLPSILTSTQTYGVAGRDILDTILTLKYTVMHMEISGGFLLNVDFSKAFDRVEHGYLWRVLERFGFGERFISRLKKLYSSGVSQVKCNGLLTGHFEIGRSIRQGCPMSAMLFSLAMEPLAYMINKEAGVRGVVTPAGREVKLFQYADDTSLVLNDEASLDKFLELLGIFCKASGAVVNVGKSELMFLGNKAGMNNRWGFREASDGVKVLGVWVARDPRVATERTWTEKLKQLEKVLSLWRMRSLTFKGKVVVLNSLFFSKINYALSGLDLPDVFRTRICELASGFLWGSRANQISRHTLSRVVQRGGLRLVEIGARKSALRLKVVMRLLDEGQTHLWKDFLMSEFSSVTRLGLGVFCQDRPASAFRGLDPFSAELLAAWKKIRGYVTQNISTVPQILGQPIFHNPDIRHAGRPIQCKLLEERGCCLIKDIVVGGRLCDTTEILGRFCGGLGQGGRSRVRLIYTRVVAAFPIRWLGVGGGGGGPAPLNTAYRFTVSFGGNTRDVSTLKSRYWYRMVAALETKEPTAEAAWRPFFPGQDTSEIWWSLQGSLFPHAVWNNEFKIRHRKIYTCIVLHQINKERYVRTCPVCGEVPETLEHIFLECAVVMPFLQEVRDILKTRCAFEWTEEIEWRWAALFGVQRGRRRPGWRLADLVLAVGRYVIYRARTLRLKEGRTTDRTKLFRHILKGHLLMLYRMGPDKLLRQTSADQTLFDFDHCGLQLAF